MIDIASRKPREVKLMLFQFWAVTHNHCVSSGTDCAQLFLLVIIPLYIVKLVRSFNFSISRSWVYEARKLAFFCCLANRSGKLMNKRNHNQIWFESPTAQNRTSCAIVEELNSIISTRSIDRTVMKAGDGEQLEMCRLRNFCFQLSAVVVYADPLRQIERFFDLSSFLPESTETFFFVLLFCQSDLQLVIMNRLRLTQYRCKY